jgi:hypothetical protein
MASPPGTCVMPRLHSVYDSICKAKGFLAIEF